MSDTACAPCVPPQARQIRAGQMAVNPFRTTQSAAYADRITLTGQGLEVAVLTGGAVLRSVRMNGVAQGDGFPGRRDLRVTCAIAGPRTLQMKITGTSDAATLPNLAQHGYRTLDGTPTWAGHSLQMAADSDLPTDPTSIPTREMRPENGRPLDLRTARPVAPDAPSIDTRFCLSCTRTPLRHAVWLTGPSGLRFDFCHHGIRPGGIPCSGIAITAQGRPDAPHQPGFPGIARARGQTDHQTRQWRCDRV